jgi:hypothetical protein
MVSITQLCSLKAANKLPAAFIGALVVGVALHYHKIVENEHFGYPEDWFPSVSATIGDRYPERSVFMLFIAITSGTKSVMFDSDWVKLMAQKDHVLL